MNNNDLNKKNRYIILAIISVLVFIAGIVFFVVGFTRSNICILIGGILVVIGGFFAAMFITFAFGSRNGKDTNSKIGINVEGKSNNEISVTGNHSKKSVICLHCGARISKHSDVCSYCGNER